ncbi:MAG TPA: hypothetical protein VNA69_03160 [Thermoanaerobaculia bacterium]|nr:hypothetical protein [Thermoanaerobaculia bacterium]
MRLVPPNPHPGVALFGVVIGFFGYIAWNFHPLASVPLFALSAWLLACFLRGLRMHLALGREGVTSVGRITKIVECHGGKGRPENWWIVHYEMRDQHGTLHRGTFDEENTLPWKEGGSVTLRYHPEAPSIFRVE